MATRKCATGEPVFPVLQVFFLPFFPLFFPPVSLSREATTHSWLASTAILGAILRENRTAYAASYTLGNFFLSQGIACESFYYAAYGIGRFSFTKSLALREQLFRQNHIPFNQIHVTKLRITFSLISQLHPTKHRKQPNTSSSPARCPNHHRRNDSSTELAKPKKSLYKKPNI